MQLSDLSDEQKSRWIAVNQEPLDAMRVDLWPWGDNVCSPKGFWHRSGTYARTSTPVPRDFIHDPAMTVMLLENLRERFPRLDFDIEGGPSVWNIELLNPTINVRNKELGRAVAEAFMLANGYKS